MDRLLGLELQQVGTGVLIEAVRGHGVVGRRIRPADLPQHIGHVREALRPPPLD